MQETQVLCLGQEDPLEKEMATHSSTLAWKISWIEDPGRLQSMESQRVGHDWATFTFKVLFSWRLSLFHYKVGSMKMVGLRRIVFSLLNTRKLSLTWILQLVPCDRMPMILFKILSWVLKERFKLQTWWERHVFLFDLHTLSIISFLLSFYKFITNITHKPETWSTFLDHNFSSVQSLSPVQLFVTEWNVALQASLSPAPRAYSNSCPSSWWYHPTISSSVVSFSSCL